MPRTYHSVNILKEQQLFLKLIDENEVDIFTITGIEKILNYTFDNLNSILENLVNKNFLSRIEKGKYCRANFRDEKVIGTFISGSGAIAYWSALNYHGLTEQFPNIVFIQTSDLKKTKVIFGTTYKFIKVISAKVAGIQVQGFGNHVYRITDVEKTIVDCFDYAQYSGGYAELLRAFNQAKLSSEKMIAYCTVNNNRAATKRLGFLTDLLEKKGLKAFVNYAKEQVNPTYNPIDPLGSNKGEFVKEWRLRLNLSREEILDICNNQY
jgi:predicted transcriptional regulator of viral defense system